MVIDMLKFVLLGTESSLSKITAHSYLLEPNHIDMSTILLNPLRNIPIILYIKPPGDIFAMTNSYACRSDNLVRW
ncbi:hypothetical protein A2791_05165 [Candidatus Saccharibacteria bacterium RIFCSPHIGHO2_01_FULL_46_30]|nr:MAG: hypothetical protein A2791_05165 [Candidatus Saccharibacteria bacterium RIFCSPHIGHO2_01_FULL_46_30]